MFVGQAFGNRCQCLWCFLELLCGDRWTLCHMCSASAGPCVTCVLPQPQPRVQVGRWLVFIGGWANGGIGLLSLTHTHVVGGWVGE